MAKDNTLYFSHDHNARNDRKTSALIREFKSAGYGIFWCTAEILHEEGGSIELDDMTILAISKDLNEDADLVKEVILKCASTFKLFYLSEDNILTASRVNKNLNKIKDISSARSEAGKKGAIAKQNQAIAKQKEANAQQKQANKEINKERNFIQGDISEIKGENEPIPCKLHGRDEMSIMVFNKCEPWQLTEMKDFIKNSQRNFEAILMNNNVLKQSDNFKIALQEYINMIQSTDEYQEAKELRRHFGNWISKKNGTLKSFLEECRNREQSTTPNGKNKNSFV